MNQKKINEYVPLDIESVVEDSVYTTLPEGYYVARYVGTKLMEGTHGKFLRHKYEVNVGKYATSDLINLYDLSDMEIRTNNKLGRIYKAFVRDYTIGEKLNLGELVGEGSQYAIIKVKPITNEKGYIENTILEYLPYSKDIPLKEI